MFCPDHRPPYSTDARARLQTAVETALAAAQVPDRFRGGLIRYVCDGILPGSFLQAMLAGDVALAVTRADPESLAGLLNVRVFIALLPQSCHGSREKLRGYSTTPRRLEI